MKNFLAIDTSGDYLSVIACKNGVYEREFLPDCSMRHSVELMERIDGVLSRLSLRAQDCDFFAAAVGAGSFTGIRIGISVAKGFALATGKPTLGVTSFDTLAYNTLKGDKILCLINALHDCYYACAYENGVAQTPAFLTEEQALGYKEQGYTLVAGAEIPLGEKAEVLYVSPLEGLEKAVLARAEDNSAFGELQALYVRKSSAEINLCK